jgi:hypothetical protein
MTSDLPRDERLRRTALLAGCLVAALGAAVLAGWAFDLPALKSIYPGMVTMKANTALAIIICGIAVGLVSWGKAGPTGRFCTKGMAAVVVALGAITLSEQLFDWELGIDQWLFRDAGNAAGLSNPGRMSPATAFCLVMMGCLVWVASWPRTRRLKLPLLEALGVAVSVVAAFALAGHALDGIFRIRWCSYRSGVNYVGAWNAGLGQERRRAEVVAGRGRHGRLCGRGPVASSHGRIILLFHQPTPAKRRVGQPYAAGA